MKTLVKIGAAYFATGVAMTVVAIAQYAFCVEGGKQEVTQFFREHTDSAIIALIKTSFVAPVLFVEGAITGSSKEED